MVLHESSTRQNPVLTPYKPNRYPGQAGLQVYPFLIDNAAQVSIVTDAHRHLLSNVKTVPGNVFGVGGTRVPSIGHGVLAFRVETQAGYPDLEYFRTFYGMVHADGADNRGSSWMPPAYSAHVNNLQLDAADAGPCVSATAEGEDDALWDDETTDGSDEDPEVPQGAAAGLLGVEEVITRGGASPLAPAGTNGTADTPVPPPPTGLRPQSLLGTGPQHQPGPTLG